MDKVKLTWYIISEQNLDNDNPVLDSTKAIYMSVCATWNNNDRTWKIDPDRHPLYIGEVHDRTVRERLKEHLNDDVYDCMNKSCNETILSKVAEIEPITQASATKDLTTDIECCLICKTQPECNTQCVQYYEGRDIEILNERNKLPLKDRYVCHNGDKS